MRLVLFGLHVAISTIVAVICLYLPGHTEGLRFINWYVWVQAVAALGFTFPPRQLLPGLLVALAAAAWGFCCAVVAAMSLGNSWL
jgi:hypothetical protein